MSIPCRGILLVLLTLSCGLVISAQTKTAVEKPSGAGQLLAFTVTPIKPSFAIGEEVVFRFRLKNLSSKPVFVSRYMPVSDLVFLNLTGPDGKEVAWQGKVRSTAYSKDAFLVLEPGHEVSANHSI